MKKNNWRLERKYTVQYFSLEKILQIIQNHPALFFSPFPARTVNSIYFDTEELEDYYQNVQGDAERKKFRLRWYGKGKKSISHPQLEIKIKRNQLGTKKIYPLQNIDLAEPLLKQIIGQDLPPLIQEELRFRREIVAIQYYRHYFLSKSGNIRITVDSELKYKKYYHTTLYAPQEDAFVIEVKYAQKHEKEAQQICSALPFRLSKNSKYINAFEHAIF